MDYDIMKKLGVGSAGDAYLLENGKVALINDNKKQLDYKCDLN